MCVVRHSAMIFKAATNVPAADQYDAVEVEWHTVIVTIHGLQPGSKEISVDSDNVKWSGSDPLQPNIGGHAGTCDSGLSAMVVLRLEPARHCTRRNSAATW